MKILFLSRLFYPHIGGVEKHVFQISKRLLAKGNKVIIIAEKHEESLKEEELFEGIQIYRIHGIYSNWFKKLSIWFWLFKNLVLIRKADIIHCHDVFFWYFPFRFMFPRKKIFTTFHGYEGNNLPSKKSIFMHKVAEVLSLGNICVGDFLKKWYETKATYVIYGAVDSLNIKQVSNRIKGKEFSILFLGRLEEETGIMEYLKALKILNKNYKFNLTVLGDGSQRKEAERFCKENNIRAIFKGFIQNINNYLYSSDFVFTSRYLGILEALSSNKNVFAIYNNSIKKDYLEMAPFAKWIDIEKNGEALAEKLKIRLKIYKEKNISNKCSEWIANQTWDKIVNIYLSLWK